MRRTLFATLEFPPYRGGVAHFYASLCHHLPAHQLTVATPPQTGAAGFDRTTPYQVVRTPLLSTSPWVWPKWWMGVHRLGALVDEHNIQQLVVGQALPLGTVAWLLHRTRGLPYVVFAHGMEITMTHGRRALLLRAILTNAAAVIGNSEFTRGEVLRRGGRPATTHVVSPGPHTWPMIHQDDVAKLDALHRLRGAPVVLCVGRLVERKGFDTLVAAFAAVHRSLPQARCVIVGDGPYRAKLQQLVTRHRLDPAVILTGGLDTRALAHWYERCDVFTMLPRRLANGDVEGFGLVYLEANRFGKPVVATRSGGVPEAVVDGVTGLLVPEGDAEAAARALLRLLRDPALAHRLGIQGLERVEREFNWHAIGERVAKLLN